MLPRVLDEVVVLLVLNLDSTIEFVTLKSRSPENRTKEDQMSGTIATTWRRDSLV